MMRKKIKSVIAIIIVLSTIFALVGCGESKKTGLNDDTVTVVWVMEGDEPTSEQYDKVWKKVNEMLLEDLNVQVELEFLGYTNPDNQKQLRLASGTNDFEMMKMGGSLLAQLAPRFAFAELTDELLQENMPLMMKALEIDPTRIEGGKVDGVQYAIPMMKTNINNSCVAIRGDLREKYGLDVPTCKEDIYEYIKVIVANESGMMGLQKSLALWSFYYQGDVSWGGLTGTDNYVLFDATEECNLFMKYTTEEYYNYALLCRELKEAGCWSTDAINDSRSAEDLFESGLTAAYFHNVDTCGMRAQNMPEEWNVEIYRFGDCGDVASSPSGSTMVFNPNSEHLESALQVLDLFMFDEEYYNLIQLGFEGENWEDAGEGYYRDLDGNLPETEQYKGNWYATWNLINKDFERRNIENYTGVNEIFNKAQEEGIVHPLTKMVFNSEVIPTEKAVIWSEISRYANALEFGMVADVDTYYKNLINALETAGLDKFMAEVQKQAEEFLKN